MRVRAAAIIINPYLYNHGITVVRYTANCISLYLVSAARRSLILRSLVSHISEYTYIHTYSNIQTVRSSIHVMCGLVMQSVSDLVTINFTDN